MDRESSPGTGGGSGPAGADATGAPAPRPGRDRTTRQAALIATLVALPVTLVVAGVAFARLDPDEPEPQARPSASATASPRPQPSTPVEMAAPALAERPATVCRALLSQLPTTLRDLAQRPVTAGAEQNAAYGEPALTVACGGTEESFPPTDDVWLVNRVCWHSVEQSGATVLSTVDREVPVRVTVPRAYEQPLQWVAPISETVVATVPSGGDVPPGCQG
jgi:hypothetical protein